MYIDEHLLWKDHAIQINAWFRNPCDVFREVRPKDHISCHMFYEGALNITNIFKLQKTLVQKIFGMKFDEACTVAAIHVQDGLMFVFKNTVNFEGKTA